MAGMIAGVDFSTKHVDIVLLDDDTDRAEWHRFGIADPRGAFFAARNVRAFLPASSWWEERGVWLIGIEDPLSHGARTAKALGMIAGALSCRLPQDITVIQTRPGEWRKEVGLPGNATKGHVRQHANGRRLNAVATPLGDSTIRTFPASFEDWPEDACDAYCIAYAVRKLNNDAIARTA